MLFSSFSSFKQLPLNFNLILELFIHTSFGKRLFFDVKLGVNLFDNPLDSHSNLILELFIHTSSGERLFFDVKGGVTFSFDNTLDSHSDIMCGRPENAVILL